MADDDNVYEITEEQWRAYCDKLIAEVKSYDRWWDLLRDCHIKCSDFPNRQLSYELAIWLSSEDEAALYAEAERMRNAED